MFLAELPAILPQNMLNGTVNQEKTLNVITDMERALEESEQFNPEEDTNVGGISLNELVEYGLKQVNGDPVSENEILGQITNYLQENSLLKNDTRILREGGKVTERLEKHPEIEYDKTRNT
jgi:hypothetical protein